MFPAGATLMFGPAAFGLAVVVFPSVGPTEAAAVALAAAPVAVSEDRAGAVDDEEADVAGVAVPVEAAETPECDEAAADGAGGGEDWLAEQPATARTASTA
jgi:hypothetical protein